MQTTQLTIGFGRDVSKLATSLRNPDSNKVSIQEEKEEKPLTFWQKRRKVYQEMIDNLYVKYMERLVEIQQEQAKYWQSDNSYIYPRGYYDDYYNNYDNVYYDNNIENLDDNGDDNGETSSDGSGSGDNDNNHLFIPPIKITEDTSATF